ncbi:MAG TPA: hypothetical protein VFG20_09560 [Planctomycetaceae bacterium]|nr:hypothetical protein [Planctomycetaceae bacterium]
MASGWLQKAQAVFGHREEPPQLYVITCECGMTYSGIRASKPQKTVCSRCGSGLFIFPACPYPLPESVARRMRGEEVAPVKRKESERPSPENRRGEKKSKKRASFAADLDPPREPTPTVSPREQAAAAIERVRTLFTPLRLIVLALAVTVGGTIAVAVRQSQFEHARRNVEPAIERGMKAYADHDFGTASTELSLAVQSLDRLGRSDPISQQVRQRAREAQAAASLLSSSLSDALLSILQESSSESLTTRVERRLAGQWLFLDAPLLASTDTESRVSSPRLTVEGTMLVGKLQCRMEFSRHPGTGWPQPKAAPQPQRAIFAAQLETIRLGEGRQAADAVIVLSAATALLWTSADGYAGLVPPPTDAAEREQWQAVLDTQRTAINLPKETN